MYLISREWSKETPFYFYKTTNLINNKFYYGSGSKRKNYLGSSKELKIDIKKYGKENFKHERLRFFRTRETAFVFEFKLLKLIDAKNIYMCYNLSNFTMISPTGQVTVKDKDGNTFNVCKNDTRYLSGELVSVVTNTVKVKDSDGNITTVSKNDPRYLSGDLVHISTNKVNVRNNKTGQNEQIDKETFYQDSDKYSHVTKDTVPVRDKNNNTFRVDKNDPRYLSGELVPTASGQITVRDKEGNTFNVVKNDPRYLSGEVVPLATGFVTIKDENGSFIKVKRDDPRTKSAIYPTTGMWNWNKFIILNNKKQKVKEIADKFGIKCSKVKEYLEHNKLNYKEI